LPGEEDLPG
nr:Chain P, Carbonic anhydrase 9 [synthetic construct]